MSTGAEAPKPTLKGKEQLAAERAGEKVKAARWDLDVAAFFFATSMLVIILVFQGIGVEIVAPAAVAGLTMGWLIGQRKGQQQYKRFYNEELRQLQEFSGEKKAETFVPSPLTPRETEVLSYIARGYTNKEIAHMLHIGEQTIKNHVSSILSKLDVNDRTQAVVLAMHNNWVSSQPREPSESTTN